MFYQISWQFTENVGGAKRKVSKDVSVQTFQNFRLIHLTVISGETRVGRPILDVCGRGRFRYEGVKDSETLITKTCN